MTVYIYFKCKSCNKVRKVARYKIKKNCCISIPIIHYQKRIKKTISFTIASKINLTKEVKDLYTGNYMMFLKGTEEDTNKMEIYYLFIDWKN